MNFIVCFWGIYINIMNTVIKQNTVGNTKQRMNIRNTVIEQLN